MALPKPNAVPNWASTTSNVVQPPAGKRDQGWLFQEIPPSSFENWRARTVGEWLAWVNERFSNYSIAGGNGLYVNNPDNPTETVMGFIQRTFGPAQIKTLTAPGTTPINIDFYTENGGLIDFTVGGIGVARINPVNSYFQIGSNIDNLQIYGTGILKSIIYGGSAFKQFRWDDSLSVFEFYANNPAPSLRVDANGIIVDKITFDNGAHIDDFTNRFEIQTDGQNSALRFYKASDSWEFEINGAIPLYIEGDKIYPSDPVVMGEIGASWEDVVSKRFSVESTSISQPVNNKYDRVSANSVTAAAHLEAGTLSGTPFNISSVTALGVGFYDIEFTSGLSSNPVILGTAISAFVNVGINQLTGTKIQAVLYNTQSNGLTNADFSIAVIG